MPHTTSYWCYRCSRFVAVLAQDGEHSNADVSCPHCNGGFIEQIPTAVPDAVANSERSSPQDSDLVPSRRIRRSRRLAGDRSPFNPVIVLRGAAEDNEDGNAYEFYYDDGTGSGLRPVPATISEFLMGSGFDQLLEQLARIEVNGFGRPGNPPASKAVVEAMPTVEISETHVETNCAVCKEPFELGGEAREMPCKHIYHSDCILPWLAMRNSCPVCRHELPADQHESGEASVENGEEEVVGLTIWRLPGGGFAVGRFSGGRRGGEREFPGVFTEMDGGFGGNVAAPRRVSWMSRRSRGAESGGNGGGFGRVFRGLVSYLRRIRPNSSSSSTSLGGGSESASVNRSSSHSSSMFGRYVRRRRRGFDLEVENGADRW